MTPIQMKRLGFMVNLTGHRVSLKLNGMQVTAYQRTQRTKKGKSKRLIIAARPLRPSLKSTLNQLANRPKDRSTTTTTT